MIHAFNFTCNRDLDLSILMMNTFKRQCPNSSISTSNTDLIPEYKEYGCGAGWPAAMMKLKALRDIVRTKNVQDSDFVLSVDSDVVFCSHEVFEYIKPEYGLIGIQHQQPYQTRYGNWGHMSGALIFIRGDVAKKMAAISEEELNLVRFNHFKPFNITENEDVVLSYLAKFCVNSFAGGTVDFCLPGHLSSGSFEQDVSCTWLMRSFYHLNYCPIQFLGQPIAGKWDIPSILRQKGIEL